jgi:hypothetical protein
MRTVAKIHDAKLEPSLKTAARFLTEAAGLQLVAAGLEA